MKEIVKKERQSNLIQSTLNFTKSKKKPKVQGEMEEITGTGGIYLEGMPKCRCLECGWDMGPGNDRQLCGKLYCKHPNKIFKYEGDVVIESLIGNPNVVYEGSGPNPYLKKESKPLNPKIIGSYEKFCHLDRGNGWVDIWTGHKNGITDTMKEVMDKVTNVMMMPGDGRFESLGYMTALSPVEDAVHRLNECGMQAIYLYFIIEEGGQEFAYWKRAL